MENTGIVRKIDELGRIEIPVIGLISGGLIFPLNFSSK